MGFVNRSIVIACAVALALGAAACGSSSSASSSSAPTSAAGGGSSSMPTSTTAVSSDTGGGSDDSGFCESAKAQSKGLQKELKPLASMSSSPAKVKATWSIIDKAYSNLVASAPSDIKPDLLVMYGAFHQLKGFYAANNYNTVKALPQVEKTFTSAKFKHAVAHLEAWSKANCNGLS